MNPFKVGDKVRLTKPQAPFPNHWPAIDQIRWAFGMREKIWDLHVNHNYVVKEVTTYASCPAVKLMLDQADRLSTTFVANEAVCWPIECISLQSTLVSTRIICDCPLNVILSLGCRNKEHC